MTGFFGRPALYALDEDGRFVEPWYGNAGARSSTFTWHPGVPGVLDVTDPRWPNTLALLDVDTLQLRRIPAGELDGKWQVPYRAGQMRRHLEERIAEARRYRQRFSQRWFEVAMRRIAGTGAPSRFQMILARAHPEHPLEHGYGATPWLRRSA